MTATGRPLEAAFRRRILAYLKARYPGGWWTGTWGTAAGGGLPDVVGTAPAFDGVLVGIELKTGDNAASKLQAYVLERMRRAGGIAGVARSLDDLSAVLTEGRKEWLDRRLTSST